MIPGPKRFSEPNDRRIISKKISQCQRGHAPSLVARLAAPCK
jgi:hypothetical protein